MLRKIISIDEEKCNGCGDCVPACAEGALQIIDGKARLISDLFCDALGACIGYCPEGAIKIIEREAEPYDERKVMTHIIKGGENTIKAHLEHLLEHNELEYYNQAIEFLKETGISIDHEEKVNKKYCACPGSSEQVFERQSFLEEDGRRISRLTQWPVQLHLLNPRASFLMNSELLIAADCVPFAYADFHKDFLSDKTLAIACPKLDDGQDIYLEKLVEMIRHCELKSITVLIMQVPCCGGLFRLVQQAVSISKKEISLRVVVIGINGEVLHDEQVEMLAFTN